MTRQGSAATAARRQVNRSVTSGVRSAMAITSGELEAWNSWLRAANRSTQTIQLRTYHVRRVMREIGTDPLHVTAEQLVDFLGAQPWKASTRRSYRASLRVFFAWAQATGRRADNPAALTPEITVPRSLPRPVPDEILLEAVRRADERVRKMLLLAASCGLRRGELARARREDITPALWVTRWWFGARAARSGWCRCPTGSRGRSWLVLRATCSPRRPTAGRGTR